jgi:hypothetical protein
MRPVKLAELEPWLIRHTYNANGAEVYKHVDTLDEAQGIIFDCPICRVAESHSICVWFKDRGVPESAVPAPRWAMSGTSTADLTLAPSINITHGCKWHGFIIAGVVSGA